MLELLTTLNIIGIVSSMKAINLIDQRNIISENAFVEMVVWKVPQSVKGSEHAYKYRLALVIDSVCVLRYDNEIGKGDHKHIGNTEVDYQFTTLESLFDDFWADAEELT